MADLKPPPLNFGRLRATQLGQSTAGAPKEVQHPKEQGVALPPPSTATKIEAAPSKTPRGLVAKPAEKTESRLPAPKKAGAPKPTSPRRVSPPARLQPSRSTEQAVGIEVANPLIAPDDGQASRSGGKTVTAARGSGGRGKRRASRFQMTEEHLEALRWMDKARYSTAEQVAVYLDRDNRSTRKLLGKLEAHGYVKRKQFAGFPVTYYLSESAKDLLESSTRKVEDASGPGFIRHTISVGWVMLAMLKGGLPVAQALAKELGRPLALTDFISESELQRASNRHFGKVMTALEQKARKHDSQAFVRKWEGWKAVAREAKAVPVAAELDDANLFAWAFYGDGLKPHYPDLVLRIPRSQQSDKPLSIAFEIERSVKPASVDDILSAYKDEATQGRYGQCVWFCGGENVATLVKSKVQASGAGHAVTSLDLAMAWKHTYVTHLEEEARAVTQAHQEARQQGWWHVTGQLALARCSCGTTCRAKYGRFATRQEAFDYSDELA